MSLIKRHVSSGVLKLLCPLQLRSTFRGVFRRIPFFLIVAHGDRSRKLSTLLVSLVWCLVSGVTWHYDLCMGAVWYRTVITRLNDRTSIFFSLVIELLKDEVFG